MVDSLHKLSRLGRYDDVVSALLRKSGVPVCLSCLFALYGFLYFAHVERLGLYADDWLELDIVARAPLSHLAQSWPIDYRPFEGIPWILLYRLAGTHLSIYYAGLFAVEFSSSVFVFFVSRRLTGESALALLCSALWAVYPGDASVFWLTTFAYRCGALFYVCSVFLLFARTSGRTYALAYAGSVASCCACLLCNELYLGLLTTLPILSVMRWWRVSRLGAIARGLPFAMLIFTYTVYRRYIGPQFLHLPDNKGSNLSFDLAHAGIGILNAVSIDIFGAWLAAVSSTFQLDPDLVLLPTAAVCLCFVVWASVLATLIRLKARVSNTFLVWEQIRPGTLIMALGACGMVLGFVPLVFTDQLSSVGEISSRVNAASTFGAALFASGAVWVVANGLPAPPLVRGVSFGVMALVLLGLASVRTVHVEERYQTAWNVQRVFWRSSLPRVSRAYSKARILILAPSVSDWDTISSIPPFTASSALSLAFPQAHWDVVVAFNQGLQACGIVGSRTAGHHIDVWSLLKSGHSDLLPTRPLDTSLAAIAVTVHPSPSVRVLSGVVPLKSRFCRIMSQARLLGGHPNYLSPWVPVMTAP